MKIRIVGGPGSGKSYLAKKLAAKYSVPLLDLDEIKWASKDSYTVNRPPEEKISLFREFFDNNESWVIEGASANSWNWVSFQEADYVVVLKQTLWREYSRVLKRSLKRRLGLVDERKENISRILGLYRWAKEFRNMRLPEIIADMDKQGIDYKVCSSSKDVWEHLP